MGLKDILKKGLKKAGEGLSVGQVDRMSEEERRGLVTRDPELMSLERLRREQKDFRRKEALKKMIRSEQHRLDRENFTGTSPLGRSKRRRKAKRKGFTTIGRFKI